MKHFFLLILVISFVACAEKPKGDPDSIQGSWKSIGYGRVAQIKDSLYVINDVTSNSCVNLMEGPISELAETLKVKNDTLSYQDGINTYFFVRTDNLPKSCLIEISDEKVIDPEYNFEVLAETFKKHYAYFELRGVSWDNMYSHYRPLVTSETTNAELFLILDEMLESFGDGHIDLDAPDDVLEAAEALAKTKEEEEEEEEEEEKHDGETELNGYTVAHDVAKKYIPNGKFTKNRTLNWGILDDNMGYVQLNMMMGLANYSISDTLSFRDHWMAFFALAEENDKTHSQDEIDGMNESLDLLMTDLKDTKALIIDVRFNGGGQDEVGMAFLSRLNNKKREAFTKRAKMENGFTPTIKVMQGSIENAYIKPVYILTSPESASATEIMTLSSLSIPHITRIGSNTEGVFSDVLDKELPNGWDIGLSNEIYLDNNGKNYEGVGVPPDIEIGYSRDTQKFLQRIMRDLEANGDAAIEKARELENK